MCTQCVVHWVDTSLPPQNSISIRSAEFARLTGVSNTHRQAGISDHRPQTCQIGRNRPHLFCACDATEKTADFAGPNSPKRANTSRKCRHLVSASPAHEAVDQLSTATGAECFAASDICGIVHEALTQVRPRHAGLPTRMLDICPRTSSSPSPEITTADVCSSYLTPNPNHSPSLRP